MWCGIRAEEQGWLFREQPVNDIGIDAHIEYVEDGEPRQLLALQIKSGVSWFSRAGDTYIPFYDISPRQYLYWTRNMLPCVLVLYNPETEECVWQELNAETINKVGKGYRVDVPLSQVFLDEESHERLVDLNNLPPHALNYNFLQNFELDYDFYEDDDHESWHQYECIYDREFGEWLQVGDSFEEFRSALDSLNPMRFIDHGGEIAEFMLNLRLNDLGRSFLAIDGYLMRESLYCKARPKVMGEGGEERE